MPTIPYEATVEQPSTNTAVAPNTSIFSEGTVACLTGTVYSRPCVYMFRAEDEGYNNSLVAVVEQPGVKGDQNQQWKPANNNAVYAFYSIIMVM